VADRSVLEGDLRKKMKKARQLAKNRVRSERLEERFNYRENAARVNEYYPKNEKKQRFMRRLDSVIKDRCGTAFQERYNGGVTGMASKGKGLEEE